jgi:hypothetical protein
MGFAWEDGSRVRFEAGGATLEARMHGPAPDRAPTIVLLMTIVFMAAFTWSVVRTARTEKRAARDART